MSQTTLRNRVEQCREAALHVVWSQWSVLGGQVGGRVTQPSAIVDPEALLLFSCALRDDEPRLWDLIGGFLVEASSLLSVQRTKNLAGDFPQGVREVLADVGAIAVSDGKDARWRSMSGDTFRTYREGKVFKPTRSIADPPALLVRLRLGFGVHARTDALAFLLGIAPSSASAKEVAEAIGYGPMPVRRALESMATSRIVVAEGTRPEQYHAVPRQWAPLLANGRELPTWRYWHLLFAFLAVVVPTQRGRQVRQPSPYLESSELRRLVLKHRTALTKNRIPIPEPSDYPGEEYLQGFGETLEGIANWLRQNA